MAVRHGSDQQFGGTGGSGLFNKRIAGQYRGGVDHPNAISAMGAVKENRTAKRPTTALLGLYVRANSGR